MNILNKILEMERTMKRKIYFVITAVIGVIALTACAASAPIASATTAPANTAAEQTTPPPAISTAEGTPAPAADTSAASTLACGNGSQSATVTPELTEGPYFTANSPERASLLEAGTAGTKLVITGYVYTTDCKPVANALLDFWQADANGVYDNSGYNFRGHQFTDANGRFQLTTVVPGIYTGRTEHIHVKIQAPNGKLITSQLFFPGVADNESDKIFDPGLLLEIQPTSDGQQGQFNFIVPAP
jgi:protocatechuate 3,4-dioxygenase beta subunit